MLTLCCRGLVMKNSCQIHFLKGENTFNKETRENRYEKSFFEKIIREEMLKRTCVRVTKSR